MRISGSITQHNQSSRAYYVYKKAFQTLAVNFYWATGLSVWVWDKTLSLYTHKTTNDDDTPADKQIELSKEVASLSEAWFTNLKRNNPT